MYKWFALKRVLKGIFTYIIIIFIMSVLFNTVNEQTMRASIEDQVRAESMRLKNMQPSAIQRFQQQRRDELIHLYRLDRPLLERILFRTWNTVTFNFGKSTIIKSSRGERDVITINRRSDSDDSLILFTLASSDRNCGRHHIGA